LEPQEQATFKDWAIVEVMGHNRFAGFVTTQTFGAAVLFRIDVPELPEKETILAHADYCDSFSPVHAPAGSKVMREKVPGYTKLIGAGSIYAITPCTEETAIAAVLSMQRQPLRLLELPVSKQIPAGSIARNAFDPGGDEPEF
jgi:hypothetical protein